MKNFLLSMLVISTLVFTIGCSKDNEDKPGPSISFTGDVTSAVLTGDSLAVEFVATINAEGEISTFTITKKIYTASGSSTVAITPQSSFKGETSVQEVFNQLVRASNFDNGVTKIEYIFNVTDKQDLGAEKIFTVTKARTPLAISTYTAVIMGAQSNMTDGSYLYAVEGTVANQTTADANQGSVDIVYYYGASNFATLVAPNDVTINGGAGNLTLCQSWTTKNATKFGVSTLTATEFDAINNDTELYSISGLTATKLIDLAIGDVISFTTVEGKNGLIKVTALTTGLSGAITITVKVQQ